MADTTRRDALERTITYRLLRCDEAELEALDRMLIGIEKRRDILEVQRQINGADALDDHRVRRVERVLDHQKSGADITAALRELRDASTYTTQRPSLFVVRDDDEPSNPQP